MQGDRSDLFGQQHGGGLLRERGTGSSCSSNARCGGTLAAKFTHRSVHEPAVAEPGPAVGPPDVHSGRRPRDSPRHDSRRRQRLSGVVCRPHDRLRHSGGGRFNGRTRCAGTSRYPREQHRLDRRIRRVLDCVGHHLHDPGAGVPGVLEGIRLPLGRRHRRARGSARRAVLGAAAPVARRRAADELSRRPGRRRSAARGREPVAGSEDPEAARHWPAAS